MNTYKDKKVLVTGVTGFKGSWLSIYLHTLGAKVLGFSLPPEGHLNMYHSLSISSLLWKMVYGDVRYKELLNTAISYYKPDFIFHLSAQPLVRQSYIDPYTTFETNIMGTVNILEAVRKANIKCSVINVTSDKCYKNNDNVYSFKEDDPMGGYDPYSASKGVSELVTDSYRNSFFNPKDYNLTHQVGLASARAGNVIGGGDWSEDRLIPDIIRSLTNSEELIIRNPNATRPWQHVLDCLTGYLKLGVKLYENPTEYSEGWNFGANTEDVITVKEVISKFSEIWGDVPHKVVEDNCMKEAKFLSLDTTKAKTKLNWNPVYNVNESIEKTINWYRKFYIDREDILRYTLHEVRDYIDNLNGGVI